MASVADTALNHHSLTHSVVGMGWVSVVKMRVGLSGGMGLGFSGQGGGGS